MALRDFAQRWLARRGLRIARVQPPYAYEFDLLLAYLADHGINQVVDVGANEGQFVEKLFASGFTGSVVSFEAMPDVQERLARKAAGNPRWIIAPAMALSDRAGTATFHVAGNSISSSLLPMEELHVSNSPDSGEVAAIQVRLARLDDVLPALLPSGPFLLKIDTQGTELDVLNGADGIMPRVAGIKTEMSFRELYSGQPLFVEAYQKISSFGFSLYHFIHGFRGAPRSELLQCDCLFFRQAVNEGK
jgi:FkbM family methyltransferase